MKTFPSAIEDVVLIAPTVYRDNRGYFFESFNERAFQEATGVKGKFVQDNQSRSKHNVLRGLHLQLAPREQGKLVRCTVGAIFDVAVDVRPNSPTLGQWVGYELSAENHQQLWIPPGFAHGFLTLSETAEVLYKTTDYWTPALERCIRWDDPTLQIDWPAREKPFVSDKDAQGVSFEEFIEIAPPMRRAA